MASPHIAPVTERNTLDYMVLVWGVCYTPHKRYPCDRIFSRECKNRFLGFLLLISDLMLAIFTKPSSVTKRNIMDGVDKLVGMAYTPHQCSYSDRKTLTGRKAQKCPNRLQKHQYHPHCVVSLIYNTLHHTGIMSAPPDNPQTLPRHLPDTPQTPLNRALFEQSEATGRKETRCMK